jgi:hypothetical protein
MVVVVAVDATMAALSVDVGRPKAGSDDPE